MRRLVAAGFLVFAGALQAQFEDSIPASSCATPESCAALIPGAVERDARPGAYPSPAVQSILKRLLQFGDEGITEAVLLLSADDELVARSGAVALREANVIDPIHLPAIIRGMDREVSWLAPALGRIGGPRAAEAAVRYFLKASSSPHNQEAYAIRLLGTETFPFIVDAADCGFGCDDRTHWRLAAVLPEMDVDTSPVALELMALLESESDAKDPAGVLRIIGSLGESGLVVEDRLLEFRRREEDLSWAVDQALIGIGSDLSGEIFAEQLRDGAGPLILRDIAEAGPSAYQAGYEVLQLLDAEEAEVRLLAARALGFLEFQDAVDPLILRLDDEVDVRMAWVAAESLGRIGDFRSLDALEETAERHWYEPVREQARRAASNIEFGGVYDEESGSDHFPFLFFAFEHMRVEDCEYASVGMWKTPTEIKTRATEDLQRLAYPSIVYSYGASDEAEQLAEEPDGIVRVTASNVVEHQEEIEQVPDVAYRVEGGWLLGSNRGEWGGELVYSGDDGAFYRVLSDNIEDIYRLGQRYVVPAGLAHLISNEGSVYEIYQDSDRRWRAKVWKVLPGAPWQSWITGSGDLLLDVVSGGRILLSEDGSMQMAPCE